MAEAFPSGQDNILCRYFVHGVCRDGGNCRFSHDRSTKMDNVCRYYLKGRCTFAGNCRYDHIKPKGSLTHQNTKLCIPEHALPPLKFDNETSSCNMVSLKKALKGAPVTPKTPKPPEEWVQAVEFIPGKPYKCLGIPSSYADAAATGGDLDSLTIDETSLDSSQLLCPFSHNKACPYGDECDYIHGNVCELCGLAVLIPDDIKQNESHTKECMEQHERDMEIAFAVARSKDKQCGICMDTVLDKEPVTERRFGIMSDCTHCFCLACIRKWRASKQFDSKTIRSCPECRVQSDFVTPSKYWVDTKDEKIKLIQGYKRALSEKSCRYFDQGRGECPFNERCFYKHTYPDGTLATPQPRRQGRRRTNADGDLNLHDRIFLWDFLEERHDRVESLLLLELLEDDLTSLLLNINANNDSDDSDYEFW